MIGRPFGIGRNEILFSLKAIEDHNRSEPANLLANINPTFSWVRLAQRVPVRVSIDQAPAGVKVVAGWTVSVGIGAD
ncbi:multidrug resistance efflux pump [Xanthobacter agilis]|uniref:Multidrug resistance efflux pump n=1 Tax=Xanthobacter agilis TaxID=47492 RepID=A0ABU0LD10_XANAG|nr:multidrug resistance efflux pump [Xanthobacter agilis]